MTPSEEKTLSKAKSVSSTGAPPKLSAVDVVRMSFETERLMLRRFTSDDYQALYDMRSQGEVVRYLYGGAYTPEKYRLNLINAWP
ncbi:GNAT family N-acetyltransferase [Kiloniella sp.]|uniref:GNAT family N-acetyltransferase n=1 Tax=Kiloniella sp. TaxID=1938587 RepID=UPI003A950788